ncbi:Extracellular protein SEL-1 and related proteins [Phaffia rhodozyma]|uniref:Extracellular protein SEL-1 and related proteins n=1 Tax=Phaffia rhodozyma TaxID=264483 RepID=A0A0F7SRE5_PHARH|nr:Extracellular protein SEL-1 and related proteins [Phaffia rhodozyma]
MPESYQGHAKPLSGKHTASPPVVQQRWSAENSSTINYSRPNPGHLDGRSQSPPHSPSSPPLPSYDASTSGAYFDPSSSSASASASALAASSSSSPSASFSVAPQTNSPTIQDSVSTDQVNGLNFSAIRLSDPIPNRSQTSMSNRSQSSISNRSNAFPSGPNFGRTPSANSRAQSVRSFDMGPQGSVIQQQQQSLSHPSHPHPHPHPYPHPYPHQQSYSRPNNGRGTPSVRSLELGPEGYDPPIGGYPLPTSFNGPPSRAPGPGYASYQAGNPNNINNTAANTGYHHQQQQQQQQHSAGPAYPSYSPQADYSNPYHAAATGVVGYPPVFRPPMPPMPSMPPIPQGSIASPGGPSLSRAASSGSSLSGTSLVRSGTVIGSSNAKRQGSSATVDTRKPPYTKAFVDEYRARMKRDPDSEAQFAFAKYLIEAAKKLGSEISTHDPKAGRKYRDTLIGESLKLIKKLATQSEEPLADAQFFLADLYGTGQLGLQADPEKAYTLYLQASKQNHPGATYRSAVCNELGAGTRREPNRAILFFRKAASLGDTTAMYRLGMILLEGKLQQAQNVREGVHWLRLAASQADASNPHALHELGMMHENPPARFTQYIHLDHALAREFFTQAAQLGYPPSQLKLGTCFEYGNLTCEVDPRKSISWYTKAAEKGNAEAELALSGWYLTGSEGVLKQSDSESFLWARKAANKGLAKAEYAVGYYSEQGIGTNPDLEAAKGWYNRAALQHNKRATQRLAGQSL